MYFKNYVKVFQSLNHTIKLTIRILFPKFHHVAVHVLVVLDDLE